MPTGDSSELRGIPAGPSPHRFCYPSLKSPLDPLSPTFPSPFCQPLRCQCSSCGSPAFISSSTAGTSACTCAGCRCFQVSPVQKQFCFTHFCFTLFYLFYGGTRVFLFHRFRLYCHSNHHAWLCFPRTKLDPAKVSSHLSQVFLQQTTLLCCPRLEAGEAVLTASKHTTLKLLNVYHLSCNLRDN